MWCFESAVLDVIVGRWCGFTSHRVRREPWGWVTEARRVRLLEERSQELHPVSS